MRFAVERGLALVALLAAAIPALGQTAIGPGTAASFASAEEGARVLSRRDGFVAAMSPFDRSARLETDRDVGEEEYLAFVARQAREWTEAERNAIGGILEEFRKRTAELDLGLPRAVTLIKTSGAEEGHAAYCRGAAVILPENVLAGDPAQLRTTVFHELFHVSSSHHPERRAALYDIVGFEVAPEIALPESLRSRKLTNPDAPRIDSVIRVRVNDRGSRRPATPVLLAAGDRYDVKKGGQFFDQMEFRLLVLDEAGGGRFVPANGADGRPALLAPAAVPDYLEQVGRNTRYIIHPEEILADNFVLLIDDAKPVPTPKILERLRALLAREPGH